MEYPEIPSLRTCKGCPTDLSHPEADELLADHCNDCATRLGCDCCLEPDESTRHRPETKSFLRDACFKAWQEAACDDCGEPNGTRNGCACLRSPGEDPR